MDLKKETAVLMKKLEKPMELKRQLIDLDISLAIGRLTKEEYEKYAENVYQSITQDPHDLILELIENFYSRFNHYFRIEESKEKYERLIDQVYIYQHGYNECTGHEEEEKRVYKAMMTERKRLYHLTGYPEYEC